jgi:hypothetical protein
MGKALLRIWNNLANISRLRRTIIKSVIFLVVLLFVLFPNPALVFEQIEAYVNTEMLFETNFPEMSIINARIDSLLPPNYSFEDEYKVIVRFVYDNIHYQFDWDNWANSEYWPSASKVWRRGNEDCDGQAILAVAIFRSRGYRNADIVGSMQHLWIMVNGKELMGPDTEKLVVVENGKKQFRVPSWHHMLETAATTVDYFPKFRIVILLITLLGLLYHPAKNLKRLLALVLSTLVGFTLLVDWAHTVAFYRHLTLGPNLIIGSLLILASLVFALLSKSEKEPAS